MASINSFYEESFKWAEGAPSELRPVIFAFILLFTGVSAYSRESTRRWCMLTCVCVCVQLCWLPCSCSSSMMVPGSLCSTGFACSIPTRMCEGE
jgi:hypothetical protein